MTTTTSLASVTLDGERHEVQLGSLHKVRTDPRDCRTRNREVHAAGGWYVGVTLDGEPFVTTADHITIAMPQRIAPLTPTRTERAWWWGWGLLGLVGAAWSGLAVGFLSVIR